MTRKHIISEGSSIYNRFFGTLICYLTVSILLTYFYSVKFIYNLLPEVDGFVKSYVTPLCGTVTENNLKLFESPIFPPPVGGD